SNGARIGVGDRSNRGAAGCAALAREGDARVREGGARVLRVEYPRAIHSQERPIPTFKRLSMLAAASPYRHGQQEIDLTLTIDWLSILGSHITIVAASYA
ncbi:MAG: hypothetical protein AAF978_06365, partial [Cyanobacteria bacterium P01_E01_bin.48]